MNTTCRIPHARAVALVALAAALMASVYDVQAAPAARGDTVPAVRIDSGRVDGVVRDDAVDAYLGIPYAAPPVRDLRWRAPQAVAPWFGVLHADRYAPQCPQPLRSPLTNQYGGPEITSENCLYLNVWTRPGLKKAPVIVYLHGGAFFIGSASLPLYAGEAVAPRGAVFVNFNYRLGVLGFLAHPELTAESPNRSSGNYALMDQVAALQWVRRNAAAFGGDPNNVTIVGQSAGAMAIHLLQAAPAAAGLFHRIVAMSAPIGGPRGRLPTLAAAEQQGLKLQLLLKAKNLADLRALPADRFGLTRGPEAPAIGPMQDGHVLPESIDVRFARGVQHDVPLVLGFTRDESFGEFGAVRGIDEFRARAQARFGDRAEEFLQLYPAATDAEAASQARAADRDAGAPTAMYEWATAQVATGRAPVYAYEFARAHSYAPGVTIADLDPATAGAYHTSEVPFWLGTLDSFNRFRTTRNWTPADRAFSGAMIDSLVAFARTGNPATRTIAWPRFDARAGTLLEFGASVVPGAWPDTRKLRFFAASTN